MFTLENPWNGHRDGEGSVVEVSLESSSILSSHVLLLITSLEGEVDRFGKQCK